jgi:group I intron endonuclease
MIGFIYCIKQISTGKSYVGQSIDPRIRWLNHLCSARYGDKSPLYYAMRKYGFDDFNFIVLCEVDGDQSELDKAEDSFISSLDTLSPNGFNLRRGGFRGVSSEETKQRMRETWALPEIKQKHKISRARARKNFSDAAKLAWLRPEVKERHIASTSLSNEQRSATLKQTLSTPESRALKRALGFDSTFITNGQINRKIRLSEEIPEGWKQGVTRRSKWSPPLSMCPHCGLSSNIAILHRWHFDNCPKKKIRLVRNN